MEEKSITWIHRQVRTILLFWSGIQSDRAQWFHTSVCSRPWMLPACKACQRFSNFLLRQAKWAIARFRPSSTLSTNSRHRLESQNDLNLVAVSFPGENVGAAARKIIICRPSLEYWRAKRMHSLLVAKQDVIRVAYACESYAHTMDSIILEH